MRILSPVLALMMVIFVGACGGLGAKKVTAPPVEIDISHIEPLIFDNTTDIKMNTWKLTEYITKYYSSVSRFKPFQRVKRTQALGGTLVTHKAGVNVVKIAGNKIRVSYDYELHFANAGTDTKYTRSTTEFEIIEKVVGDKNEYHFKMTKPIVQSSGGNLFGFTEPPLDEINSLAEDFKSALAKIKPRFSSYDKLSGEFAAKYNEKAVKANFDRILDNTSSTEEGHYSMNRYLSLDGKKDNVRVTMAFYPYRQNQTKIRYMLESKYYIDSFGRSTFNKDKFKQYEAKLKQIAND